MEYANLQTRKIIWHEIWRVNRVIRYCKTLQNKYAQKNRIVKVIVSISLLGSMINVIAHFLPEGAQIILNAMIGVTVIYDLIVDYGKKSSVFFIALSQCRIIDQEYHELWIDIMNNKVSNDEAHSRNDNLMKRLNNIISTSDSHDIAEDDTLNSKCAEEAKRSIDIKYQREPEISINPI